MADGVSPGRQALIDHRDDLLGKIPTLSSLDEKGRRKVLADLVLAEAALEGGKILLDGLKGLGMLEGLGLELPVSVATVTRKGKKVEPETMVSLKAAMSE